MRLIDADNIRGCAKYIKVNEDFDPYIMVDDLVKLLDEQPTAYDIDKVDAELEKREEHYVEMLDWKGQSAICDAIEIVKLGGIGKAVD